jgi:uncharacterized protein with HEPN domain
LPSKHDPADSLTDIVENAERIAGYILGMDQASFERNGMTRDAVERCLERICEAIYRLDDEAETFLPGQPVGEIRGMGNQLRHAYDRLSLELIWATVDLRVPELAGAARQALTKLDGGNSNAA